MSLPHREPVLRPASGASTWDNCPDCSGMGWVRYDVPLGHKDFGQLFPCPTCGPARKTEWLRRLSRLTGSLADATLAQWHPMPGVQSVLPDITKFLFRQGDDRKAAGWIILSGPYGTGKTHLLAALVNHYIAAGRPAIYVTMQDLLQELRDTYDEKSDTSYSQLWKDITVNAQVLAIDELEKYNGTQWAQEQVYALLNTRYNAMNTGLTILATNVDLRRPNFQLLPDGPWAAGYLESRVMDARNLVLSQFWGAKDARRVMDVIEQQRLGGDDGSLG